MIGPFSEEQIAYMQTSAEKREPFRVEVQLKDKNGRKSKIRLEGERIDITHFDKYYKDLWDEPYLVHVAKEDDNGNAGLHYAERVADFITPSVSEWIKEFWEKYKQFYDFEGAEEQIRWF